MTQTDQELDRIERSIDIDATAEKVWSLIERPGWWINEGEIESDREVRREGEADVVVHPKYGEFRLLTLASEPPRHLAVTWLDGDADAGPAWSSPSLTGPREASRSPWSSPGSPIWASRAPT